MCPERHALSICEVSTPARRSSYVEVTTREPTISRSAHMTEGGCVTPPSSLRSVCHCSRVRERKRKTGEPREAAKRSQCVKVRIPSRMGLVADEPEFSPWVSPRASFDSVGIVTVPLRRSSGSLFTPFLVVMAATVHYDAATWQWPSPSCGRGLHG